MVCNMAFRLNWKYALNEKKKRLAMTVHESKTSEAYLFNKNGTWLPRISGRFAGMSQPYDHR